MPQGAEYRAVIKAQTKNRWQGKIVAIPIGVRAVVKFLGEMGNFSTYSQVLGLGLCGSLNPKLKVGDMVVYSSCFDLLKAHSLACSYYPPLNCPVVKSCTSDRLVHLAKHKQDLYRQTQTDVVDMEGYGILQFYQNLGIPVGMVRVVSDDCQQDLPDLSSAIDDQGNLKPLPMATTFLQQPQAALRLIRGSLQALAVLAAIQI